MNASVCNITEALFEFDECFGGECQLRGLLHYCNCDTGYTGVLCSVVIPDAHPNQWVAELALVGLIYSALFLASVVLFLRYWRLKRVRLGRANKEMVAIAFAGGASLLNGLSSTINPFRFHFVRAHRHIPKGYDAWYSIITNVGLALVACGYALLLSYWVSVRTAKIGARDWSHSAAIVFSVCAGMNLFLAIVLSVVEAYLWNVADLIFQGYLALFALAVGGYIIVSGIVTIRMHSKFSNQDRSQEVRKLAVQLVFVATVLVLAIIILLCITLINWEQVSPILFIWVRGFLATVVQGGCIACLLYIFAPHRHPSGVIGEGVLRRIDSSMVLGRAHHEREPEDFGEEQIAGLGAMTSIPL